MSNYIKKLAKEQSSYNVTIDDIIFKVKRIEGLDLIKKGINGDLTNNEKIAEIVWGSVIGWSGVKAKHILYDISMLTEDQKNEELKFDNELLEDFINKDSNDEFKYFKGLSENFVDSFIKNKNKLEDEKKS